MVAAFAVGAPEEPHGDDAKLRAIADTYSRLQQQQQQQRYSRPGVGTGDAETTDTPAPRDTTHAPRGRGQPLAGAVGARRSPAGAATVVGGTLASSSSQRINPTDMLLAVSGDPKLWEQKKRDKEAKAREAKAAAVAATKTPPGSSEGRCVKSGLGWVDLRVRVQLIGHARNNM